MISDNTIAKLELFFNYKKHSLLVKLVVIGITFVYFTKMHYYLKLSDKNNYFSKTTEIIKTKTHKSTRIKYLHTKRILIPKGEMVNRPCISANDYR